MDPERGRRRKPATARQRDSSHPLTSEQKLCIQKSVTFIRTRIDCLRISDELNKRQVIDSADYAYVFDASFESMEKGADCLIEIVMKRTSMVFETLVRILGEFDDENHQRAYKRLRKNLKEAREHYSCPNKNVPRRLQPVHHLNQSPQSEDEETYDHDFSPREKGCSPQRGQFTPRQQTDDLGLMLQFEQDNIRSSLSKRLNAQHKKSLHLTTSLNDEKIKTRNLEAKNTALGQENTVLSQDLDYERHRSSILEQENDGLKRYVEETTRNLEAENTVLSQGLESERQRSSILEQENDGLKRDVEEKTNVIDYLQKDCEKKAKVIRHLKSEVKNLRNDLATTNSNLENEKAERLQWQHDMKSTMKQTILDTLNVQPRNASFTGLQWTDNNNFLALKTEGASTTGTFNDPGDHTSNRSPVRETKSRSTVAAGAVARHSFNSISNAWSTAAAPRNSSKGNGNKVTPKRTVRTKSHGMNSSSQQNDLYSRGSGLPGPKNRSGSSKSSHHPTERKQRPPSPGSLDSSFDDAKLYA